MVELLEKITAEKCWAITAKILTGFFGVRGDKIIVPLLGKGEKIIAPVLGWEKWIEINNKIFGENAKRFLPWVKETFNIPVEDAVGALKLLYISGALLTGPEFTAELVEATPERAVLRITKCAFRERQKELEVDRELVVCGPAHQAWSEEGFKAINPRITCKLTKAMPRGDPYCEEVFEFRDE